jgi:hypothetical protein
MIGKDSTRAPRVVGVGGLGLDGTSLIVAHQP